MRTKILFLICLLMAAQSVASKDFNLYDNRGQVVIDIDTIIAPVVCSATKMLSDDIESLDSKLHVKIDRHKPDIIGKEWHPPHRGSRPAWVGLRLVGGVKNHRGVAMDFLGGKHNKSLYHD